MKHALPPINKWLDQTKLKDQYPEAVFVGEFPVAPHANIAGSLFWQPNPPHDYSNYFLIYYNPFRESVYITSGKPQSETIYTGLITPNGDFIYSRHRHDCVNHDGCMIDGGDAYVRTNSQGDLVTFRISGHSLELISD